MALINLLVLLIVIGALLYVVETVLPIDAAVKTIIRVFIVIALLLYLVRVFLGAGPEWQLHW